MDKVRQVDFVLLDRLFDMEGGFVLNFSNPTFARFFVDELNINIFDPAFSRDGTSKAKRLRCLLQLSSSETAVKILVALWEYREATRIQFEQPEKLKNANGQFLELLDRLKGKRTVSTEPIVERKAFNWLELEQLKSELTSLNSLTPQDRGYKFETLLKAIFDAFGMKAREPFRLKGEQIDGSFDLNGEIYLLEAKWHNVKTGVGDLHAFHGKIDQKASWARGLFVSYTGFTDEGLHAFGKGKRVICMDGLDIFEALNKQIPLSYVIQQKARRAAETGETFVRI